MLKYGRFAGLKDTPIMGIYWSSICHLWVIEWHTVGGWCHCRNQRVYISGLCRNDLVGSEHALRSQRLRTGRDKSSNTVLSLSRRLTWACGREGCFGWHVLQSVLCIISYRQSIQSKIEGEGVVSCLDSQSQRPRCRTDIGTSRPTRTGQNMVLRAGLGLWRWVKGRSKIP